MSKTILIINDKEEDVKAITQLDPEMSGDCTVLTASSGTKSIKIALQLQPIPVILMTVKEQDYFPESAKK